MKKILSLILALTVVMCLFGCESSDKNNENKVMPVSEESGPDWKTLYKDFLFEKGENPGYYYVGVNDLNLDGVPELILSGDAYSAAYWVKIFKIVDGKVEYALDYATDESTSDIISLYSNFDEGWITLRKNVDTGEIMYFIESGNGSATDSFGGVYSFSDQSTIVSEFEYIEYSDGSLGENVYVVNGENVTKNGYDVKLAEFYENWENTGYVSNAIVSEHSSYPEKVDTEVNENSVKALFDAYESEVSYK